MKPGVNRNSHGLKVAQLAGMPQLALDIASKTLLALKDAPGVPLSGITHDGLRFVGDAIASRMSASTVNI